MADSNVYVEGVNSSIIQNLQEAHMTTDDAVKSIDLQLKEIVSNGLKISQSSLQDLLASGVYDRRDAEGRTARRDVFAERRERSQTNRANALAGSNANKREEQWERDLNTAFNNARPRRRRGSSFDDIMDSWENEFQRSLFGTVNPIKQALTSSVSGLAQKLGVSTQDLAKEVGSRLGKMMGDAFKNNPIGARLSKEWNGILGGLTRRTSGWFNNLGDRLASVDLHPEDVINSAATAPAPESSSSATDTLLNSTASSDVADSLSDVTKGAEAASEALRNSSVVQAGATETAALAGQGAGELATAVTGASAAFPALTLALVGAGVALKALSVAVGIFKKALNWAIGPIKEGISGLLNMVTSAATRQESRNSRYLQLWRERVEKDITSLREASYNVIKESANHITEVWDSILTTVTATQGYTKAGVQDLWANYAERLSNEGLSSVVSSADIMEKLQSVLESGLSGQVAEEFSYIATKLNAAIPTEDFFQYASTYASLAANAIKEGKSQAEAIQYANNKLETFASNLLYASREIAGGFTTSLVNGSSLFEQSAKIALTSRTGDVAEISGVLTSVSGIVGAIAPDLADGLVNTIVEAATGGNSSNITALRSMAGTGASNTAFLQALAKAPQEVFSTLFRNLAELQNMSAANYMEVAEGLSEVFGISMDAFARVDFAYLADAISAMSVSNASLNDNINQLISGETTSTAAQLRMQKINEYMIDEGLAYVLDNEAARSIQEHMWEEQMMRDLVDSTFAVDFAGTAYESIQKILAGIKRVVGLFDGSLFSNTADTFKLAALEMAVNSAEVKDTIKSGVVGGGNETAFTNLTTGYTDLNLVPHYADLLKGNNGKGWTSLDNIRSLIEEKTRLDNAGIIDTIMAVSGTSENQLLQSIVNTGGDIAIDSLRGSLGEGGDAFLDGLANKIGSVSKSDVAASTRVYGQSPASKYSYSLVSKSTAAAASSGDWRTSQGYNPLWDAEEAITSVVSGDVMAKNLQDSISTYINRDERKAANARVDNIKAEGEAHRAYLSQSELLNQVTAEQLTSMQSAGTSFEAWKEQYEKDWNAKNVASMFPAGHMITPEEASRSYKTLEEILADYGADISQIEALYNQQENMLSSAQTKARELHEVQFWEDMQNFATKDFPDYMLDFKEYMKNWADYYIRHTAYGNETAGAYVDEKGKPITGEAFTDSSSIGSLMMASEQGQGDAILALAQMLTDNATYQNKSLEQLKDPTLQTNAILSKILLTVEAIFQQNNEVSVVSVPTSLSALGLGVTNT